MQHLAASLSLSLWHHYWHSCNDDVVMLFTNESVSIVRLTIKDVWGSQYIFARGEMNHICVFVPIISIITKIK